MYCDVRARAVLGGELDVLGVLARLRDRRAHLALDVLARGLQLALDVDVARGDERVDARALGVAHRVPGRLDVLLARARQAADDGALHLASDRLHRLEVAGRCDREAGLDHVHAAGARAGGRSPAFPACSARSPATARRRAGSCRRSGRDPRRCAARCCSCRSCSFSISRSFLSAGYAATRPPRAIPPEGGAGEGERSEIRNDICGQPSTGRQADESGPGRPRPQARGRRRQPASITTV